MGVNEDGGDRNKMEMNINIEKINGVGFSSISKIKNGSVIAIGKTRSLKIKVDHHFNWFQKKMIGLCFGFKVEDYDE